MKLKEIVVTSLYNDYDCSIRMCDGNLTFLHSLNGTGKSTILRMVCAVFDGNEKVLEAIPFKKLTLAFDNDTTIGVVKRPKIECLISTKEHEDAVPLSEVKGYVDLLYISPERTAITLEDGRLVSAIGTYISEFSKLYTEAKKDDTLKKAKKLISVDEDRFVNYCQNLKAKLDYIGEAGLKVNIPSDIKFPPNRYEYTENREKYDEFVSALAEWIDGKYVLAESIIIYLDIVNKLFHNKDMSIDARNNMCIMVNGSTPVPVNGLSAGEKQILIIFYRLLFHAKNGSLVFMDEPEISLHVTWQQSLGSIFADIARVRDLQMLIATHSPQVIHDKWDLATELRSTRA